MHIRSKFAKIMYLMRMPEQKKPKFIWCFDDNAQVTGLMGYKDHSKLDFAQMDK